MGKGLHNIIMAGAVAMLSSGLIAPAAAFEVPRYVYEFADLEQAQQEGFDDKKPLLFLWADPAKEPT